MRKYFSLNYFWGDLHFVFKLNEKLALDLKHHKRSSKRLDGFQFQSESLMIQQILLNIIYQVGCETLITYEGTCMRQGDRFHAYLLFHLVPSLSLSFKKRAFLA